MATTSNAWVMTGGFHRGVMKMVGQALKDQTDNQGNRVPVIGFATWGFTRNRHHLVNGSVNSASTTRCYKPVDHFAMDATSLPLDSNHTHFILVDDGTVEQPYRCNDLLKKFRDMLGKETDGGELNTYSTFLVFLV